MLKVVIFLAACVLGAKSIQVEIEQGVLKGKQLHTWKGRPINAFMSIPYAKPPLGKLRFKVRRKDRSS